MAGSTNAVSTALSSAAIALIVAVDRPSASGTTARVLPAKGRSVNMSTTS